MGRPYLFLCGPTVPLRLVALQPPFGDFGTGGSDSRTLCRQGVACRNPVGVAETGYAGCLRHCIVVFHFPSHIFPPLLPFAKYIAVRAFCFVRDGLCYIFALRSGVIVYIGIGEHGIALSQQGTDSGLFLFHPSVMAAAQASGEAGTDSVVCIGASGYPKDFAGAASVTKATFHFPFQYQAGERHRHSCLFLHRDGECVFLREVIPVSKAFFLLQGRQEQIEEVFRYFGLVDALCSVSELRDGLPYYTLPEACDEGETLHAEGLYHPLIEHCIPNDITLCGSSVLVTGSNMSGKTTFIRAIGLNLLSAQVFHTCFARSFRFPMDTALFSAIHLEDSLMEGKSFFLQEVQIVREMLEVGKGRRQLFLLDELFKGTNTVERIAIAKAVLSALAHKNSIVFASTHDVELASLLENEYESFHFCECVADNTLSFDYKLKPGPATERNAIRIIEMCGYPKEVVGEAYRLAKKHVL